MSERPKEHVSKTCDGASHPWVQIPPVPPRKPLLSRGFSVANRLARLVAFHRQPQLARRRAEVVSAVEHGDDRRTGPQSPRLEGTSPAIALSGDPGSAGDEFTAAGTIPGRAPARDLCHCRPALRGPRQESSSGTSSWLGTADPRCTAGEEPVRGSELDPSVSRRRRRRQHLAPAGVAQCCSIH